MVAQIDAAYRALGPGRLARRLVSYAFFEGRPATTRGQWFNPFVLAWLRLLASLPGSPNVTAPILISGLGRSGTTLLGLLLSAHPDVGFLNEPKALWHVVDPRQDVNGNFSSRDGQFRFGAQDATDRQVRRLRRLYARYLRCVGATRVVDKYPELIFRVPYVRALLPDARIIFIQRNGVDACQSIVRWSERLGRGQGHEREDWWGRNDIKWRLLWSELVLPDPDCAELADLDPKALSPADRAAIEWVVTMREGLRQSAAWPEAVIRIRYEDLLARPGEELPRLLVACGLKPEAQVATYAHATLRAAPAKEMPALHPAVHRLFNDTMTRMGYADKS